MEPAQGPFSILIPDADDHEAMVLQVINCLSFNKDILVYVMCSKRITHLKFSRYVHLVVNYSKANTIDWIGEIDKVVNRYQIDLIFPVFELGIKKLIENRKLLKHSEILSLLPEQSDFKIAGNKDLLYFHLKDNDLQCPESTVTKKGEYPITANLTFPIIAKPVYGFGGGNKIKVLNNNKDVLDYVKNSSFDCNTIFQDYIKGHDVSCNVLCQKGSLLAYSIQDASIFNNGNLTPQEGFNFVKNEQLLENLKALMKSLNWSGVANIDFRYDENDKSFKIIEINPRYWMNVEASTLAGVNFPYLHCLCSLNNKIEFEESKQMNYLNLKGLVRSIAKKPQIIYQTNYLWNNTALRYAIQDPLPMVYRFVWRTKNIIVKKISRRGQKRIQ